MLASAAFVLVAASVLIPPNEVPSVWRLLRRPMAEHEVPVAETAPLDRAERRRLAAPDRARRHLATLLSERRHRYPAGHHEDLLHFWVTPVDDALLRAMAIAHGSLLHASPDAVRSEIARRAMPASWCLWLRLVNRRAMERDPIVADLKRRVFLEVDGRFHRPAALWMEPFARLKRGRDVALRFPRRGPDGSLLVPATAKRVFLHVTGLPGRRARPARVRLDPSRFFR